MDRVHAVRARVLLLVAIVVGATVAKAQEVRIELQPSMLANEAAVGDPSGLVDEQREIIGPPAGTPKTGWTLNAQHWKQFPFSAYLDLGAEKNLSSVWFYDTNDKGEVVVSAGEPGSWREVATYDCAAYLAWAEVKLDVTTRYLRITRKTPGANFTEIAVYEYTEEAYRAMVARKAEEARLEAERQAALAKAREEALRRPLVEMAPYGTLSLVEEIDCAADAAGRIYSEYPPNAARVETILDRKARVLPPCHGEASFFSYRVGRQKLLRPGGTYVLAVEYPEDGPRSMVVINTGNETSRGFHTGVTVGDAFHAKYVNNLAESIDVPLSGRWETWSLLFQLHDRFAEKGLVRGPVPRTLTPEDGFDVTLAQFSAENVPFSQGLAVSRIRLYEVLDPDKLAQPVRLPPDGLPRRRLFWREEMADGVIDRKTDQPGIARPIDWYRYKAALMRFLGMNTFSKDLLEFGACQHWDTTPHGGHDWAFHDDQTKHLWGEIVELMGRCGHDVLPYYEYSGGKGYKGLGNQRRARPLTRDDAFTHITWIESANADITDPDTYADFQKVLDLTVVRLRAKAPFAGIWLRPRGQLPIGFSQQTLTRFAEATGQGRPVTREALKSNAELYNAYVEWWGGKRCEFLTAMRDYLRTNGVDDALVLFTGCPGEPGVPFYTWDPCMITDRDDLWRQLLQQPDHVDGQRGPIKTLTVQQVVDSDLYLQAITSPSLNWGDWEVHHSRPADDPHRYRNVPGILFTHAINRNYTVASPRTFAAYRGASGLAVVRHYALNENMMVDKNDKELLGYFIADIERAGPYCMMAEAHAVANGDPTVIGYLIGSNFGRGFPHYVREFNANFLALPALPSRIVDSASSDKDVVVRQIDTAGFGTWLAVVNTALQAKTAVSVKVPAGVLADAVTGRQLDVAQGRISLDLYPCQLKSFHLR